MLRKSPVASLLSFVVVMSASTPALAGEAEPLTDINQNYDVRLEGPDYLVVGETARFRLVIEPRADKEAVIVTNAPSKYFSLVATPKSEGVETPKEPLAPSEMSERQLVFEIPVTTRKAGSRSFALEARFFAYLPLLARNPNVKLKLLVTADAYKKNSKSPKKAQARLSIRNAGWVNQPRLVTTFDANDYEDFVMLHVVCMSYDRACRAAFKHANALHQALGQHGLRVVGFDLEDRGEVSLEAEKRIQAYVDEEKFVFPISFDGNTVHRLTEAYPRFVVIEKGVRDFDLATRGDEGFEAVTDAVRKALAD